MSQEVERCEFALSLADAVDGFQTATHAHKLVFVAQKESRSVWPLSAFETADAPFDFEAGQYGPQSRELAVALEALVEGGLLNKTVDDSPLGEKWSYSITEQGREVVEERNSSYTPSNLVSRMANWPVDRVLKYVKQEYPEYKEKRMGNARTTLH